MMPYTTNLSGSAERALAKLRSRQRLWRYLRWYSLSFGLVCTGAGVWLIYQIARRASAGERWDGEIVWLCPAFWMLYFLGLGICTIVLSKWRGDPTHILLLELLDKGHEQPGAAGNMNIGGK